MRRTLTLLAAGTTVVLLAAAAPGVTAAPGGSNPAPSAALPRPAADGAVGTTTVTLVTGHRLRVDSFDDGRHAVTALPAPGAVRANLKVVERPEKPL